MLNITRQKIIRRVLIVILFLCYCMSTIFESNLWGNILSPVVTLIIFHYVYIGYFIKEKVKILRVSGFLLSLSIFNWFVCDLIWFIIDVILKENTINLLYFDYAYSITNITMLISILIFGIYEARKWNSVQLILNTITVATCVIILIWIIFLDRNMKRLIILQSDWLVFATIIIDFLLFTWTIICFFSIRKNKTPLYLMISTFGVLLFVMVDFIYYYQYMFEIYKPNTLIDFAYVLTFTIIAIGSYVKTRCTFAIELKRSTFSNKGNGLILMIVPLIIIVFKGFRLEYLIIVISIIMFYFIISNFIQKNIYRDQMLKKEIELNEQLEEKIKKRTQELNFLINKDMVTGLNNRRLFLEQLDNEINNLELSNRLVLFFIDINKYKMIKTIFGSNIGEKVLREIGQRLAAIFDISQKDSLLAIYGDDIFVYTIKGNYDYLESLIISEKIIEACSDIYNIENYDIKVTVNIGISIYPLDADNRNELIKNADLAMSQSRNYGFNQTKAFDSRLGSLTVRRHRIEMMLKTADFDSEFYLMFQPQVSLKDMKINGFEALLRWNTKNGRLISSSEFIPIAEEIGTIVPLGDWVMRKALMQLRDWNSKSEIKTKIAINVSVKQLSGRNFVEKLKDELIKLSLPPNLVEIEITENIQMEENSEIINILHEIRNLGILISIDDFGTGYSSLYYLKYLPVYRIKIAKSLIDRIDKDNFDYTIVKMVIEVAKVRRIRVIAEGVETKAQFKCLEELQCDEIQGYYFGKPVSPNEAFETWLKT